MVEAMLIDLRALLLEREECDAGTVARIREALAQGKSQYRTLKEITQILKKKLEETSGAAAQRLHLKLGIAAYFVGHLAEAVEHLQHANTALANFYLGKALLERREFDAALQAFEKAQKLGYTASQVELQKAGILRQKGDLEGAREILSRLEDQATHNAEYHYQVACCYLAEGDQQAAVDHLERAVQLDPTHTGALFQLAHLNDRAGNDEEAISLYERCLSHPPVHVGVLMNLGILYEDNERFEQAADCFEKILKDRTTDEHTREQARLFLKDAIASQQERIKVEEEPAQARFGPVLDIPVTDFELSVRARNCLRKMNIRTLGDLTRVTEQQLLSSKNFGETSLQEIKEMMASKGLKLGQSLEDAGHYDRRFGAGQQLSEQEQAILAKPVTELNLSVRARKCMNRLGISTLGDLVQKTADELLESKNFGVTSLTEVREKLRQYGLTLRGD